MHLPQSILKVMDTFEQNGFVCYVVGGAVRDHLLSRPISDYDLCTNASPQEMQALFPHTIPTGIKHGTVTIIEDGDALECTTFRKESTYVDHRHPSEVRFVSSLDEDLSRRDFTINAFAYSPKEGIIDRFSGKKDLEDHVIRAIGDPDRRFDEDALRMVRAHRFAAKLHFHIDPKTQEAIHRNAAKIKNVAVERLVPEWEQIMWSDPFEIKRMLDLLDPWLHILKECEACEQISPYHTRNVLDHILEALSYNEWNDHQVVWALLFHDVGKPAAKTTDENGRDHFRGHAKISAQIADRIMKDLKFSNKDKKAIHDLVLYHDDFREPSLKWLYTYRVQLQWNDEQMKKLFHVQRSDILAHSKKGRERLALLERMRAFYEAEKAKRPLSLKALAINGRDVMEWTGQEGSAIRTALDRCLEYAFYHPEKNTKEALKRFLQKGNKG